MATPCDERLQASHEFYLHLVSIIQSLAGTFLIQVVFQDPNPRSDEVFLARALCVFLIIVVVWHEYATSTLAYLRITKLSDSFIPFLFGLAEAMAIASLPTAPTPKTCEGNKFIALLGLPHPWLVSIILINAIAVVAYWNRKRNAMLVKEELVNPSWIKATNRGMISSVVSLIFLIGVLLLAIRSSDPDRWISYLVLLVVLFHMFMVHVEWGTKRQRETG